MTINGEVSVALLSQLRVFDSSRFEEKMGMASLDEYVTLKKKLAELLLG
jgi:hypothetical protein